ncbi:MAG: hypothetical protein ABI693_33320 [Bryobacteraceae bacterium]
MAARNDQPADLKRMLAQVCVEHSVRIDTDDPAVAVVELNRLILESVLAKATDQIRAATAELDLALERVQVRAGALLAKELRGAIQRASPLGAPAQQKEEAKPKRSMLWTTTVAGAAFLLGILVGVLLNW